MKSGRPSEEHPSQILASMPRIYGIEEARLGGPNCCRRIFTSKRTSSWIESALSPALLRLVADFTSIKIIPNP
jgi:hypothetical protein